jgi:hypothetical protein
MNKPAKAKSNHHSPSVKADSEPKHGQGLLARVDELEARLEATLAELQPHPEMSLQIGAIESSLNALEELRAGTTDLSDATAALLNQWLETNKNLAMEKPQVEERLRLLKAAHPRRDVVEEGSTR